MSSPMPNATTPVAPFEVYSVHFDFPGGQAITLRNPVTGLTIGRTPEWVAGGRNELAAYVRATRPEMRVVFHGTPSADGTYTVGADGTLFQVQERQVTLAFDAGTELSNAVIFRASVGLPDQIGVHPAKLDWYVRVQPALAHCPPAGTSTHRLATSWRPLATPPTGEDGLPNWVYRPLMEWTCQWAAGQNNEMAICDAIIRNLSASGLRYGIPAYDIPGMLQAGGGMCSGWYQMFQHMAHCQGVFVYRRRFLVDWRRLANGEEHWCAIVIRRGGLNQANPTHPASDFHDNDTMFPIPVGTVVSIVHRTERRYRFWGPPLPGLVGDGHCINFLVYNGQLYLYDACFGAGPIQIHAPLPVNNTSVVQGGASLAPFKAAYLDGAIDYMLYSGPRKLDHLLSY